MRVSQLISVMDRDDWIIIDDYSEPVDRMTVYHGTVRGIKRDDPINGMHVEAVFASGDMIVVLAARPRGKGEANEQRAED